MLNNRKTTDQGFEEIVVKCKVKFPLNSARGPENSTPGNHRRNGTSGLMQLEGELKSLVQP